MATGSSAGAPPTGFYPSDPRIFALTMITAKILDTLKVKDPELYKSITDDLFSTIEFSKVAAAAGNTAAAATATELESILGKKP